MMVSQVLTLGTHRGSGTATSNRNGPNEGLDRMDEVLSNTERGLKEVGMMGRWPGSGTSMIWR